MSDILSLQKSVLSYLNTNGGLRKLVHDCQSFDDHQHNEAVYRFCINVNPSDVVELDPELGDCILHDPERAASLFQSVCFAAIKTLSLVDKIDTECQVHVLLKLTHLPPFPEYTLDLASFPRMRRSMRPVVMEGLVIATTRVTKYTRGARFLCSNDRCPFSKGFHTIRVHVPGATESVMVRKDFICNACTSPLKEDVKFRVLGDKQLVELIHGDALNALRSHQQNSLRYQSVTLFLRDELCNVMSIGQHYRVIGIPAHVHRVPNITWSVEASSIQPWELEYPHEINVKLKELLHATRDSPWRFSAVITQSFGLDVVPPGLFNTLKLCLLLSMVHTEATEKNTIFNLDLLVTTDDKLILDRLMAYALNFTRRGVRHPASGKLFASLSQDEHGVGTANIHAGSVLLASGGVCMLGDLSGFKKDKLDAIQSALDSRTVSIFMPGKKYGEDVDEQLSFPVLCSFWALTDSTRAPRRSNREFDIALGAAELGSIPPQLADSFGLVVRCVDHTGNQAALAQSVHTLQQAIQPGEHLYPSSLDIGSEDYEELVAYAQNLQVDLSASAQMIIHGYYMASRAVRSQSHSSKMSAASIKLLISLAEAHCKLSLRRQILEEDAVIAVLLCENSVTLKHGTAVLVIPPDAVFPGELADADSLLRRDRALEQLHQDILRFILAYAPQADVYVTEE
ncbi:minichromosome maintenance domain-containing protein 2 [Corythoichthys intestinalis]|uniref:minichromosome maintenance domain-containing protein 2 n=1 Tax=Corythoichthys intestinalis TaxID=161448 RepID=UPI0025A51E9A|nr:minichromosome maintenance domain-containing protein 2 [Corythoichthys intestinalis]XP_061810296.1 minichromosome maintenance domain-containing protein 2-like [Nerophis lumbriciformis]